MSKQSFKTKNHSHKPAFLVYLHSFRGFAMLNILAIHAIAFAAYTCNNGVLKPKDPIHITNEILFHNSTIYFAVISGILFSAALKTKGYKRFYTSKLKYVILPYLFLTFVFSIYISNTFFVLQPSVDVYVDKVINNFIYGKAQFTFWYIPILVFLYLITPLFDYITTLMRWRTVLTILIVLSPLLISRVELEELNKQNVLSLSTMIYYSGAYMAGMWFGNNPEKWIYWIKNHVITIIIITVSVSAVIVYMEYMGVKNLGAWSPKASLYYIQKICLSGLFLLLFKTLEHKQPKWIHDVAKHAFSIYFLHAFFIFVCYRLLMPYINPSEFSTPLVILIAVFYIIISVVGSIGVTWVFKKLLGKKSRMLVGS